MPNGTPLGVVHRASPEEALKILKRVTVECNGDVPEMARKLGLSISSIRHYRTLHPELRELAKQCQVKAAKLELSGR